MPALYIVCMNGMPYIDTDVTTGVAGVITGHPFDTIKVRIQCHQSEGGIVRTAMNIIRQEKVTWMGMGRMYISTYVYVFCL